MVRDSIVFTVCKLVVRVWYGLLFVNWWFVTDSVYYCLWTGGSWLIVFTIVCELMVRDSIVFTVCKLVVCDWYCVYCLRTGGSWLIVFTIVCELVVRDWSVYCWWPGVSWLIRLLFVNWWFETDWQIRTGLIGCTIDELVQGWFTCSVGKVVHGLLLAL